MTLQASEVPRRASEALAGFRGGEFRAIIPPSAGHRATYPDDTGYGKNRYGGSLG